MRDLSYERLHAMNLHGGGYEDHEVHDEIRDGHYDGLHHGDHANAHPLPYRCMSHPYVCLLSHSQNNLPVYKRSPEVTMNSACPEQSFCLPDIRPVQI